MKVILYTTETCPRCKVLKAFLIREGLEVEERRVDDIDLMAELVMQNIHFRSAPTLQVNDMFFEFVGESKK